MYFGMVFDFHIATGEVKYPFWVTCYSQIDN